MGKQRTSSDTPGDFDLYVLAQTWAPQFCCTKSDRCTTVRCAYSANNPKGKPKPDLVRVPVRVRIGSVLTWLGLGLGWLGLGLGLGLLAE